ncbi:MAG: lipopolysaccharide biosynthesis protein [Planctomycetota bacterium]|nr:lipopolysaccharide biosynthesis protein [Planctomycetota bacterium]
MSEQTGADAMQPVPDPAAEKVAGPDLSRLGSLARRGVLWTFIQTILRNVISLGATAILARILTPRDYGLIGMVGTLTAFLQVFSDMGLSWAAIQRKDLTKAQMDNLFWINSAAGGLLWIASAAAGPLLAWFYGEPELSAVTVATGASFLLGGLAVQPMALLKRQMRFRELAMAETAGTAAGAAAGIALALLGFSYWALVWQGIAGQLVRAAAMFVAARYKPGPFRTGQGTWSLLTFGGTLALGGLFSYISGNLDFLLLGKVWGPEELGYYSRAWFLMFLPGIITMPGVSDVMRSALCSVQDDQPRFEQAYRKAVRMVAFVAMPVSAGFFATASEAVRVIYGPRWEPAVPVLRWLIAANFLGPIAATFSWIYLAKGKTKPVLKISCAMAMLVACSSSAGCLWGPEGIAAGRLVSGTIIAVPVFFLAHRVGGLNWANTARDITAPIIASVLTGFVAAGIGRLAADCSLSWSVTLACKIFAGILSYAFLSSWWLKDYAVEFLGTIRGYFGREKMSPDD